MFSVVLISNVTVELFRWYLVQRSEHSMVRGIWLTYLGRYSWIANDNDADLSIGLWLMNARPRMSG